MHPIILFAALFGGAATAANPVILDGYTGRLSVFPGDSVDLFLNARESLATCEVRLNDLQGRVVATFRMPVFPQTMSGDKPYENGYGYRLSARVSVPDLKSGVYLIENNVPLIIRARHPAVVVLYSSNTENAYCNAGGRSLYPFNSMNNLASPKVSFLRPIPLPKHSEAFLRWMDRQTIDGVGYITDSDMDDFASIRKAKLLIVPGHSEYWTLAARRNFDHFVNDGKDVMILSGNTMWWQVRYNRDKDQMICYRTAEADPVRSPKLKTVNWNDPILGYPILGSIGAEFSLAGYGRKADKGWDGYRIVSPSPLLENTLLKKNDTLHLASDEADGAPLSDFAGNKIPVIDRQILGFARAEIIGYDRVSRGGVDGVATWIVFRRSGASGIIINTASTNWCAQNGIGSNADIARITLNMIQKLLNRQNVFSPEQPRDPVSAGNKIL